VHTRPCLDSIDTLLKLPPASHAHGGLPAGTMRRVREYVDVHLSESINLAMLAAVAGLSMHHFAREFKQSFRVTRTTISRKGESNERRKWWLRRISRYRKLLMRQAFLTKAIWRVISVTYSVLRLASFGGRSASEPAARSAKVCPATSSRRSEPAGYFGNQCQVTAQESS